MDYAERSKIVLAVQTLLNDKDGIVWSYEYIDTTISNLENEIIYIISRHIAGMLSASVGNLDHANFLLDKDLSNSFKKIARTIAESIEEHAR